MFISSLRLHPTLDSRYFVPVVQMGKKHLQALKAISAGHILLWQQDVGSVGGCGGNAVRAVIRRTERHPKAWGTLFKRTVTPRRV